MKTISAQYGENVIVEFSGDGMAALAGSKKGVLDKIHKQQDLDARQANILLGMKKAEYAAGNFIQAEQTAGIFRCHGICCKAGKCRKSRPKWQYGLWCEERELRNLKDTTNARMNK